MLNVNIPNDRPLPQPKPLSRFVELQREGVYQVQDRPSHRVYINTLGDYFVFANAPAGTSIIVHGDDAGWLHKNVVPVDESLNITFKPE